jgi:hypothetical protein
MPRIAAKESDVDDIKELLPLAALACGLTYHGEFDPHAGLKTTGGWWNPLTPGDGAEMEDKLKINVLWLPNGVCSYKGVGVEPMKRIELFADHPDEDTARRWASLRVAAAIGRSMK